MNLNSHLLGQSLRVFAPHCLTVSPISLLLVSALNMSPACAQSTDVPDVVTSAARTSQTVTDALPSTTVITRAAIESAPVNDVISLLRTQVGVSIRQSGTAGAVSGITMRGGEPKHTLVLVDGVPLSSLSSGTAAIEQIPLSLIERIEVVRGNMSALYGSQATGGLVQIFTRKAIEGQQADVRLAIGDKGQRQASTQWSFGNSQVQLTAGAAHEQLKAISAQNGANADPDKDGYRNHSGNLSVRFTPNEHAEYNARFFQSNGRKDNDGWYKRNRTREQQLSVSANNQWTDAWSTRFNLASSQDKSRDISDLGAELYQTNTQQLSLQNQITLNKGNIIAGISAVRQKLKSTQTYADNQHQRDTHSVWAGYNLDEQRHHLQLNARYDDISHVGGYATGALNYGFDIHPAWRVFAGVSNGFTAPSFNDMYYPDYCDDTWKYCYQSSPNLKPEKATYAQAGVQFNQERYGARATYFDTRYRNKITYHAEYDAGTGYTHGSMQNLNRARTQGLEWHGWYNALGWTVDAGLTYQEVRDRSTDKILNRQPKWLANLALGKNWGKWSAQANWQAQSSIRDYDGALFQDVTVGGYGVLNGALYYQARKDVKFGFSVGNVLDKKYEPLAGFNAMPRSFLLSVNYKPS